MLIRTNYGVDGNGQTPTAIAADAAFLVEVKSWLHVEHAEDDSLITSLIVAAIAYLDGNTGQANRTLINSEWTYTLDCFPSGEIELPLPPSVSATVVTYRDTSGAEQTLVADTDYRVNRLNAENTTARIVPLNGWPGTDANGDAVKIVYLAGYGQTPSALPEHFKLVIKAIVAGWYADRTPRGEVPDSPAFKGLMNNIRFLQI